MTASPEGDNDDGDCDDDGVDGVGGGDGVLDICAMRKLAKALSLGFPGDNWILTSSSLFFAMTFTFFGTFLTLGAVWADDEEEDGGGIEGRTPPSEEGFCCCCCWRWWFRRLSTS